jgi:hypothetical protein
MDTADAAFATAIVRVRRNGRNRGWIARACRIVRHGFSPSMERLMLAYSRVSPALSMALEGSLAQKATG